MSRSDLQAGQPIVYADRTMMQHFRDYIRRLEQRLVDAEGFSTDLSLDGGDASTGTQLRGIDGGNATDGPPYSPSSIYDGGTAENG